MSAEQAPPCRDYNCMATITDETLWCATCAARAEYLRGRSDAATSMRSLCVEMVKLARRNHRPSNNQDYEYGYDAALADAIKELESVSIQEQKEDADV